MYGRSLLLSLLLAILIKSFGTGSLLFFVVPSSPLLQVFLDNVSLAACHPQHDGTGHSTMLQIHSRQNKFAIRKLSGEPHQEGTVNMRTTEVYTIFIKHGLLDL
jgi:hypothetical protein